MAGSRLVGASSVGAGLRGATLRKRVLSELKKAADPDRAPAMQAYMKSSMPYLGVSSVPLRAVAKVVLADYPFDDPEAFRSDVLAVFRGAHFREERYMAVAMTGHRKARPFQTMEALPMYEALIVEGAWWDIVDAIAHRVGDLLEAHPSAMKKKMRVWSRCDDMWKRRISIICQLGFAEETDLDLLYAAIEPSIGSKEFFLRKAIGWALRELAWSNPDEVIRYVGANAARLSPLSKREALKNVIKQGRIAAIP